MMYGFFDYDDEPLWTEFELQNVRLAVAEFQEESGVKEVRFRGMLRGSRRLDPFDRYEHVVLILELTDYGSASFIMCEFSHNKMNAAAIRQFVFDRLMKQVMS